MPAATPPQIKNACGDGEILLWDRQSEPVCLTPRLPKQVHRRHTRKYAQGELGPDKSFYFKGPDDALNLRAENLQSFLKLADGVDDATWTFHRGRGEYSRWLKDAIKDDQLAEVAATIEQDQALMRKHHGRNSAGRSKNAIRRRPSPIASFTLCVGWIESMRSHFLGKRCRYGVPACPKISEVPELYDRGDQSTATLLKETGVLDEPQALKVEDVEDGAVAGTEAG